MPYVQGTRIGLLWLPYVPEAQGSLPRAYQLAPGVPHVPRTVAPQVVVKGYITDAENVFMETMEVDEAKQYCNANAKCKGFTFAGPDECATPAVTPHPHPSPSPDHP